jgi:DNA processing protein
VRGQEQLPRLTVRAVAVTGNRNATAQALRRTQAFATAVAEAGHTVTATLAYGVDATAHGPPPVPGREHSPSCPAPWTAPTRTTTPSC